LRVSVGQRDRVGGLDTSDDLRRVVAAQAATTGVVVVLPFLTTLRVALLPVP